MAIHMQKCVLDYGKVISSNTVFIHGIEIGDLVEFFNPIGYNCRVILTGDMTPYCNASFATKEGALNYMKLIGNAKKAA